MSIGWRFLLFEDDGTIRRIAQRNVDKLINGQMRLPEYAGKIMRTAFVMVELDSGRLSKIAHIEGSKRHCDDEGYMQQRLADHLLQSNPTPDAEVPFLSDGNVIYIEKTPWTKAGGGDVPVESYPGRYHNNNRVYLANPMANETRDRHQHTAALARKEDAPLIGVVAAVAAVDITALDLGTADPLDLVEGRSSGVPIVGIARQSKHGVQAKPRIRV